MNDYKAKIKEILNQFSEHVSGKYNTGWGRGITDEEATASLLQLLQDERNRCIAIVEKPREIYLTRPYSPEETDRDIAIRNQLRREIVAELKAKGEKS